MWGSSLDTPTGGSWYINSLRSVIHFDLFEDPQLVSSRACVFVLFIPSASAVLLLQRQEEVFDVGVLPTTNA